MTYNMVGYSIQYEVRLTIYHMTYNMVGTLSCIYGGVLYPV